MIHCLLRNYNSILAYHFKSDIENLSMWDVLDELNTIDPGVTNAATGQDRGTGPDPIVPVFMATHPRHPVLVLPELHRMMEPIPITHSPPRTVLPVFPGSAPTSPPRNAISLLPRLRRRESYKRPGARALVNGIFIYFAQCILIGAAIQFSRLAKSTNVPRTTLQDWHIQYLGNHEWRPWTPAYGKALRKFTKAELDAVCHAILEDFRAHLRPVTMATVHGIFRSLYPDRNASMSLIHRFKEAYRFSSRRGHIVRRIIDSRDHIATAFVDEIVGLLSSTSFCRRNLINIDETMVRWTPNALMTWERRGRDEREDWDRCTLPDSCGWDVSPADLPPVTCGLQSIRSPSKSNSSRKRNQRMDDGDCHEAHHAHHPSIDSPRPDPPRPRQSPVSPGESRHRLCDATQYHVALYPWWIHRIASATGCEDIWEREATAEKVLCV